jgi:arginase
MNCVNVSSAFPAPGHSNAIFEAVGAMASVIKAACLAAHQADQEPVLIGGDHSLAIGSMAGSIAHFGRVGVVWIDAHADFNTFESSPTGNPHGMPLSAACGLGDPRLTSLIDRPVRAQDVVLIAARAIDPEEQRLLTQEGIRQISVAELRERGVAAVCQEIAERLAGIPTHLSFDFDAISHEYFHATGTPVPNGLTPDEAADLVRGLRRATLQFVSSDWVEFDPRHPQASESAIIARNVYAAFHAPTTVSPVSLTHSPSHL